MGVAQFVEEMEALCGKFGIRVQSEGEDRHYLVDVQIAKQQERASEL
jgi:hypothetical protein